MANLARFGPRALASTGAPRRRLRSQDAFLFRHRNVMENLRSAEAGERVQGKSWSWIGSSRSWN